MGQIPLRQTLSSKKGKISHFSWLRLGHSGGGEEGGHLAFVQSSVIVSTCSCKAKERKKGRKEEKGSLAKIFKKIRLGKAKP